MAIHASASKVRFSRRNTIGKKSRKGKQAWHKRIPKAPVKDMADLDPLMVSLIADGHALAR